ncbi:MAG TPA: TetR/AcrR family transcriptional regulator, partial [Eubacterium sp.]|nr:TetR/AcrR family transcriptional regulator [Eubacterium sp.]
MGRRRLSKKAKLSHAAWRLFQKNGYENTTVEDILKESRVSKGTFYHYFDGKADLLNTLSVLFDDAYEEYQAEMTPDMSASEALLGSNQYLFRLIEEEVPANLMASLF